MRRRNPAQRFTDMLAIKEAVRTRDGMKCRQCGLTNEDHVARYGRQLDVHRLVPASLYTVDGCIAVCKKCHAKLPQKAKGTTDEAWASIGPEEPARVARRPEGLAGIIAGNLRAKRAELRLTLKEVGARSGVHYVSISRYEQGKLPTVDAIYRLAEAYGVEPSVLMPPLADVADAPKPGKGRRKT